MAQLAARQKKSGLGPGFWQFGIVLTIANIAISWWIITLDINKYLTEAGPPAGDIDWLFKFMSVVANAIFVYTVGYIIYFSIVFRRKKSDPIDAVGIQIHDNPTLELWWTVIPAILVILLAFFSVRIWASLQNTLGDVLTMESIGHQFKYEFRYPKLKQSVYDDMHLPVGTPVTLHVTSADVNPLVLGPRDAHQVRHGPGPRANAPLHAGENRNVSHHLHRVLRHEPRQHVRDAAHRLAARLRPLDCGAVQGPERGPRTRKPQLGPSDRRASTFRTKVLVVPLLWALRTKDRRPRALGKLLSDPNHPNLVTGEKPNAEDISHVLINGYSGPDNSQGKAGPSIGVMPNRQANALSNADIANLTAYLVSMSQK